MVQRLTSLHGMRRTLVLAVLTGVFCFVLPACADIIPSGEAGAADLGLFASPSAARYGSDRLRGSSGGADADWLMAEVADRRSVYSRPEKTESGSAEAVEVDPPRLKRLPLLLLLSLKGVSANPQVSAQIGIGGKDAVVPLPSAAAP